MGHFIMLLARYAFTLSALSVMAVTRGKIGEDILLPFLTKSANPFYRAWLRCWTAILLFVWIRAFMIAAMIESGGRAPFGSQLSWWGLFIDYSLYGTFTVATFFHYLSFLASIACLGHIIAIDIYDRLRVMVGSQSLGVCGLTGWMQGRRVLGCTIDKYLIWCFIDPLFFIGAAFLLKNLTGSIVLFTFFLASGSTMLIQGQMARLKRRAERKPMKDAYGYSDDHKVIHGGFGNDHRRPGQAGSKAQTGTLL